MPINRTFRLFISSTFSDFIAEREALQRDVFPKLERFCAERGARFQAVDLRWGITEEAQREHDTMRICLEEVRRSQELSPRPNFAILLGDRYGWEPVPARIPNSHWDRLIAAASADDRKLIQSGYKGPDLNAIPPAYHLHERLGSWADNEARESKLRTALRSAADAANFQGDDRLPYFASATHQEIALGALWGDDAPLHVHAYVREIVDLPQDQTARDFIDWDPQNLSVVIGARERLRGLDLVLRERLGSNVHDIQTHWSRHGMSGATDADYLNDFCNHFLSHQVALIEAELTSIGDSDEVQDRERSHREFGLGRAKVFAGREELLKLIANYTDPVEHRASNQPLVLIGSGGSGKSALLAKAAQSDLQLGSKGSVVVQRYIGGVPGTESLMTMLTSLIKDIAYIYDQPEPVKPENARQLSEFFLTVLGYSSVVRPLHLYLDALDQLDDAHNAWMLEWLPKVVPEHTKVVVSLRSNTPVEQTARYRFPGSLIDVPMMNAKDGRAMLDAWLADKQAAWFNAGIVPSTGRQITPKQMQTVLQAFNENGSALWLKLAYEEASTWTSWDEPLELPTTVEGLIEHLVDSRLLKGENHPQVFTERALAYITAGRYGLSEEELARAIGTDSAVRKEFEDNEKTKVRWEDAKNLPPIIWSRLFFDIQPYLGVAQIDGALVMRWFHREFGDVLRSRYLDTPENRKLIHGSLGHTFQQLERELRPNDSNDNALFLSTDASGVLVSVATRRVNEQPWQYARAGFQEELKALLTSFGFCMGKCAANLVDDLLADFDSDDMFSGPSSDAQAWKDFMYANAHLLRRGDAWWPAHRILLQLAYEHSSASSITRAAMDLRNSGLLSESFIYDTTLRAELPAHLCTAVLEGHEFTPSQVFFCNQEVQKNLVLSWAREEKSPRLWDSLTGRGQQLMPEHQATMRGLLELPSLGWLSWAEDSQMKLWDLSARRCKLEFNLDRAIFKGVKVLPGNRLCSWSDNGDIQVWDSKTALQIVTINLGPDQQVFEIEVLSADRITVRTVDDGIGIWSTQNASCIWRKEAKPSSFNILNSVSNGWQPWMGQTLVSGLDIPAGSELPVSLVQVDMSSDWITKRTNEQELVRLTLPGQRVVLWSSISHQDIEIIDFVSGKSQFLFGHASDITGLMRLPKNRLLVAHEDGLLRLWDIDRGSCEAIFSGCTSIIKEVQQIDENQLIVIDQDDNLLRWDFANAQTKNLAQFNCKAITTESCRFDRVEAAHLEETSAAWVNNSFLHRWSEVSGVVSSLDIGSRGLIKRVQALGHDLLVWGEYGAFVVRGETVFRFEGHRGLILGACWVNEDQVLTWSKDETVRVWRLSDAFAETIKDAAHSSSGDVAFVEATNNRSLPWCPMDGWLFEVNSNRLSLRSSSKGKSLELGIRNTWDVTAFALNDSQLAIWTQAEDTRTHTSELWVWDLDSGAMLGKLPGRMERLEGCLELTPGKLLAWNRHGFILWTPQSGELITHSVSGETYDPSIANLQTVVPIGGHRFVCCYNDGLIEVRDNGVGEIEFNLQHSIHVIELNGKSLNCQVMTNGLLATWGLSEKVHFWDTDNGELKYILDSALSPSTLVSSNDKVEEETVLDVATLNSAQIATSHANGVVRLWTYSIRDAVCDAVLVGHPATWLPISINELSDGRIVTYSTVYSDHSLRVWSSKGECLHIIQGINSVQLLIESSKTTTPLAFSIEDSSVRIWHLEGTPRETILRGHHDAYVTNVSLLPNGRLVTTDAKGQQITWNLDISTSREVMNARCQHVLSEHTSGVASVGLISNGMVLTGALGVAKDDQNNQRGYPLKLWDLATGLCTATLQGPESAPLEGTLNLGDDRVLIWAQEKVYMWDLKRHELLWSFAPDSQEENWAGRRKGINILKLIKAGLLIHWTGNAGFHILEPNSGKVLKEIKLDFEPAEIDELDDGHLIARGEVKSSNAYLGNLLLLCLIDFKTGEVLQRITSEKELDGMAMGSSLDEPVLAWKRKSLVLCEPNTLNDQLAVLPTNEDYIKGLCRVGKSVFYSWDTGGDLSRWNFNTPNSISTVKWLATEKSNDLNQNLKPNKLDADKTNESLNVLKLKVPSAQGVRELCIDWQRKIAPEIVDNHTGARLVSLVGHSESVCGVAYDDTSARLITRSLDRTLRIWDLPRALMQTGHQGVYAEEISDGLVLSDRRTMVTWGSSCRLGVWTLNKGAKFKPLLDQMGGVSQVHDVGNSKVISISEDSSLRLWDVNTCECLWLASGFNGAIEGILLLSDAHLLVNAQGELSVIRISDGFCLARHAVQIDEVADGPEVRLLEEHWWLIYSGYDERLYVLDTRDASLKAFETEWYRGCPEMESLGQGRVIAWCEGDDDEWKSLYLCDANTMEVIDLLVGDYVACALPLSNGQVLCGLQRNSQFTLVDPDDGFYFDIATHWPGHDVPPSGFIALDRGQILSWARWANQLIVWSDKGDKLQEIIAPMVGYASPRILGGTVVTIPSQTDDDLYELTLWGLKDSNDFLRFSSTTQRIETTVVSSKGSELQILAYATDLGVKVISRVNGRLHLMDSISPGWTTRNVGKDKLHVLANTLRPKSMVSKAYDGYCFGGRGFVTWRGPRADRLMEWHASGEISIFDVEGDDTVVVKEGGCVRFLKVA